LEGYENDSKRAILQEKVNSDIYIYANIQDLILSKEIRKRDAVETSSFGFALNLEARGRGKS
jgi:hypothetical protein